MTASKPALEKSLLATIIQYPNAVTAAHEWIEPEHMYEEKNQKLYRAILDIHAEHACTDITLIADATGGEQTLYIAELMTSHVGQARQVSEYARQIRTCAQRRDIALLALEIKQLADDGGSLSDIAARNSRLSKAADLPDSGEWAGMDSLMTEVGAGIDEAKASGRQWAGLDTGFADINHKINGLCKSELTVIGARPSIGKTTMALQMAHHVAKTEGVGVGIFSLEMSRRQLAQRLVASHAGIDLHRLRVGNLSEEDWVSYSRAATPLSQLPIHVNDSSGLEIDRVRAKMDKILERNDIGLWIFDHLHLMSSRSGSSENEALNYVSRGLKNISRDYDVPVLALSQLNREVEHRPDKRPRLSDLRASGGIEQDADNVLLIHRPGFYAEILAKSNYPDEVAREVELGCEKTRFGPTGTVKLTWQPEYACFAPESWRAVNTNPNGASAPRRIVI